MKTIIEMAREADALPYLASSGPRHLECLTRFAALVAACGDAELLAGVEMPERYVATADNECADAHADGFNKCLYQLRDYAAAAVAKKDAEIANLHTVMMAAAVEITEHWDAHCDEEGYGPANLVRRLENGYPEQYGYDAKTLVRIEVERDALKAENERLRAESKPNCRECTQWAQEGGVE